MRNREELQANEINVFRNRAACSLGAVVMPPELRKELKAAINAVNLPLRLVMRCRTYRDKWQVYIKRVMAAITAVLDTNNEGSRIAADIENRLNKESY